MLNILYKSVMNTTKEIPDNIPEGGEVSTAPDEPSPEDVEAQSQLEQLQREEALENEKMRKEEETNKNILLQAEYQKCVDYIQNEQPTYILLEFIYLQYQ